MKAGLDSAVVLRQRGVAVRGTVASVYAGTVCDELRASYRWLEKVVRRWTLTAGGAAMVIFDQACCRGCAGQGGDHGAFNGDCNFPRGHVVVTVGCWKAISGLPEAAVIFGRGMLAWYWWFGSANHLSARCHQNRACCRGSGGSGARQRLPSGDGHFPREHVLVAVGIRKTMSGLPEAAVIFGGGVLPGWA